MFTLFNIVVLHFISHSRAEGVMEIVIVLIVISGEARPRLCRPVHVFELLSCVRLSNPLQ